MGAYLSQPIKDKETEDGADDTGLRWGAAGMQGWRTGMEDSHLACLDLRPGTGSSPPISAFAVFDGHGGAEVAKYCSAHICDVLKDTPGFKDGDVELGLKQSFLRMDDLIRKPAGQAELSALKKASQGGGSDSDGDEELLDMANPEMQAALVEQMKQALREQFRSKGKVQGGMEDDENADGDDEDYNDEEASSSSDDDSDDDDSDEGKSGKRKGGGLENGSAEHDRRGLKNGSSGGKGVKSSKLSGKKKDADSGDAKEMSDSDASPLRDRKAVVEVKENGQKQMNAGSEIKAPLEAEMGGKEGVVPNGVASNKHDRDDDDADAAGAVSAKRKGRHASSSSDAGGDGREDMDYCDANGALEDGKEGEVDEEAIQKGEEEGGDGADEAACRRSPEKHAEPRCGFDCGATAVMGLLVGGKTLVVANAGDSRCVMSRKGVAVEMSEDHKPEDEEELTRIEKAGGSVVDGRVQGNLNLSRAIGDLMYKEDEDLAPEAQMITANPDLKTIDITEEDEFLVFACDGVWNSLSSQETIDFVRERLKGGTSGGDGGDGGGDNCSPCPPAPISSVCADLCDACCAETTDGDGTGLDNVTVVIVMLSTVGAAELIGGRCGVDVVATGASGALSSSGEGEVSGEVDSSDDGKRKQGGQEGDEQGGSKGRSGKQMRQAAVED